MKVIVTGASRGIGRGIVRVLAEAGFTLGLLSRDSEALKTLAEEHGDQTGSIACAAADLGDYTQTEIAIHSLIEQMNGIDALINNAGAVIRKDVYSLSLDEWHQMINVNVNGVFYATRIVLPFMKKQQQGHVVNVSSISGYVPLPGGSGYAASKYAVTGFSESLFHEVRDDGIKVTTVFPGSVDTASHRHDPAEDHSWKIKPEEIGQACLDALLTSPTNCVSRIEVRPLRKPVRK